MDIKYYPATSREEAFRKASVDSSTWAFSELEVLGQMADAFRDGFTPPFKQGSGWACFCPGGSFLLFEDKLEQKGYGIALVGLVGHECGIDNPAAQELLNRHRAKRGQAFFASELLVHSAHISTLQELDDAYKLLEQAGLIRRASGSTPVRYDGSIAHRPLFIQD